MDKKKLIGYILMSLPFFILGGLLLKFDILMKIAGVSLILYGIVSIIHLFKDNFIITILGYLFQILVVGLFIIHSIINQDYFLSIIAGVYLVYLFYITMFPKKDKSDKEEIDTKQ